jgi:hypothetical protein
MEKGRGPGPIKKHLNEVYPPLSTLCIALSNTAALSPPPLHLSGLAILYIHTHYTTLTAGVSFCKLLKNKLVKRLRNETVGKEGERYGKK